MADLSYTDVSKAGVSLSGSAVAADGGGDTFPLASSGAFIYINSATNAIVVTVSSPVSEVNTVLFDEVDIDDIVLNIAAGTSQVFAIPSGYSSNGVFNISYDDASDVTIAGFSING